MLLLVLVLQLAQVDRALGHALQLLAFELVEVAEQPLIDAVGQQQHLQTLLAEDLELRTGLGSSQRVGRDHVDHFLAFLHARDVVGQRHAFVDLGRREAKQLGQTLAVGEVLAYAFFQHRAELVPELQVLGLVVRAVTVGQALEHAQHALGRALAYRLDVAAFLQQLAADVERQVGRIDHALDEAQVDRHQRLGVVHDEHALDVELHATALVAVPHVLRRLGRHVKQLGVLAAAFDPVVGVGQRCLLVVADLLVELLVFGVGDVALGACPQRRSLVDGLPLVLRDLLAGLGVPLLLLHQDGQRDVVAVLADDGLELPARQKLGFLVAQVQDHIGATLGAADVLELVLAAALAAPANAQARVQTGAAGLDGDAVGNDEA